MVMMMMMNCFCGIVDWRKALSLISSRDHCQTSSPSRISDTPFSHCFNAWPIASGLSQMSQSLHLFFHWINSSWQLLEFGKSSLYISTILSVVTSLRVITDGIQGYNMKTVLPYLSKRSSISFIKWSRNGKDTFFLKQLKSVSGSIYFLVLLVSSNLPHVRYDID